MTALANRDLSAELGAFIGRHHEKRFDWDAFPGSAGFPELSRAQMRYVGAGGSPKIDDPSTLPPNQFTLSIVQQPPGKYAPAHCHEVLESFLALEGELTVGWLWDDEVIEAKLGPKDLCLNASWRPHGFRNDGELPVQCSIMVGAARPMPPQYVCHPKSAPPEIARALGAKPGKTHALDPRSDDPRQREFARHVVRYSQQRPIADPAGFAKLPYIGEGGAPAGNFRADLVHLPKGAGVRLYAREVEEVYFVLDGVVTVAWEEDGRNAEARLGKKDLVLNPAGRIRSFRNDGIEDAQFLMVVGTGAREDVAFRAA